MCGNLLVFALCPRISKNSVHAVAKYTSSVKQQILPDLINAYEIPVSRPTEVYLIDSCLKTYHGSFNHALHEILTTINFNQEE